MKEFLDRSALEKCAREATSLLAPVINGARHDLYIMDDGRVRHVLQKKRKISETAYLIAGLDIPV